MDNLNLNKHISGQFNAELEHIRTQVLTMGGLVEQQLTDAITAMQDGELAKRVIEGDAKVNMMEVAIDEAARASSPSVSRPPAICAGDGDHQNHFRAGTHWRRGGQNLPHRAGKVSHQHQPLLVSSESLGRHTVQMLHDVLDAFARMDLDEAIRITAKIKRSTRI